MSPTQFFSRRPGRLDPLTGVPDLLGCGGVRFFSWHAEIITSDLRLAMAPLETPMGPRLRDMREELGRLGWLCPCPSRSRC